MYFFSLLPFHPLTVIGLNQPLEVVYTVPGRGENNVQLQVYYKSTATIVIKDTNIEGSGIKERYYSQSGCRPEIGYLYRTGLFVWVSLMWISSKWKVSVVFLMFWLSGNKNILLQFYVQILIIKLFLSYDFVNFPKTDVWLVHTKVE